MVDQQSGEGVSHSTVSDERSESSVELNIKTLDSRIFSFHVDKNSLVSSFKERIAKDIGVPVEQQRLIFRGRVLKDDHPLAEYHVENGHTLHLVERQPVQSPQPSSVGSGEANGNNSTQGYDANGGGPRNRVGQIAHSVVLGTFNVGDQGEGVMPDLGRVIGAVLNSFGIGNQAATGLGGTQPNVQVNTAGQESQGSEADGTHVTSGGHNQAANQGQGAQGIPPQIPLSGLSLPIPSLQPPLPHSLSTLSEFINRMELAFTHNGNQPSPSPSPEGLLAVELPSDARGLPTVEALTIVLQRARRLLNDHAAAALSHIAGRLQNEGVETDPTVRSQIQADSMHVGLAMQHLGSLFLELGRTILTLRMGQSPAESFVNAGPAVYISALGPNPTMVQPFPQTSSPFGSPIVSQSNPGMFGPVGIGSAPRHVNIHIHAGTSVAPVVSAAGSRPTDGEGVQGERINGTGPNNSGRQVVVPIRNIIATAVPSHPTGAAVSGASRGNSISNTANTPPELGSLSTVITEVNSRIRNLVGNMGGDSQTSSGSAAQNQSVEAGSSHNNGRGSLDTAVGGPGTAPEGEGHKVLPECHQAESDVTGALNSDIRPSTTSSGEPYSDEKTVPDPAVASEDAQSSEQSDSKSNGGTAVPVGLGLGGLQPKRRGKPSKAQGKSNLSSDPEEHARARGQQILQSLASSIPTSNGSGTDQPLGVPPVIGQLMGSLSAEHYDTGGQFDLGNIMSQVSQNLSGQPGAGSPDVLRNTLEQFAQNPLIRNTVNQISQQIGSQDIVNMMSGLETGQSSGIDLSRMFQQMIPIVSRVLSSGQTIAEQPPNVRTGVVAQQAEEKFRGNDKLDDESIQVDLQRATEMIEHGNPPADIFRAMVEAAQTPGNESRASDLVDELCNDEHLANEYMEMLRHDVHQRLQDGSRLGEKS